MRLRISLFATVVALVAVLALMPKTKAAAEIADDTPDATLVSTTEPESDASAIEDVDAAQPNNSAVIHVTAADAERLIAGSLMSVDQLWGDRIRWSEIKSSAISAWPRGSTRIGYLPTSVPSLGEAKTKSYSTAVRNLDEVANDLEESKLYDDADAIREITKDLRVHARTRTWQDDEETSPPTGLWPYTSGLAR